MRTSTLFAVAVALGLPLSSITAQSALRFGSFTYHEKADPIDDSDRSSIVTLPVDPVEGRDVRFGWACQADGLNVAFVFGKYFAGDEDNQVLVRYRFDRLAPSEPMYWDLSVNQEIAFLPMELVPTFTRAAKTASKLVLRVTDPSDGEVITHEFALNGVQGALLRLGSCDR